MAFGHNYSSEPVSAGSHFRPDQIRRHIKISKKQRVPIPITPLVGPLCQETKMSLYLYVYQYVSGFDKVNNIRNLGDVPINFGGKKNGPEGPPASFKRRNVCRKLILVLCLYALCRSDR
jgi:hypothetical protein